MEWFGILIVSPLWAATSTTFFFQTWAGFFLLLIGLVGFMAGRIPARQNLITMFLGVAQLLLFSSVLYFGNWFLPALGFGFSSGESIVYLVVCALTALYVFSRMPRKLKNRWRFSTQPSHLEAAASVKKTQELQGQAEIQ